MKQKNMKFENLSSFCDSLGLGVVIKNNPNGVGSLYEFFLKSNNYKVTEVIGYRDALNFAKGFSVATKILLNTPKK